MGCWQALVTSAVSIGYAGFACWIAVGVADRFGDTAGYVCFLWLLLAGVFAAASQMERE